MFNLTSDTLNDRVFGTFHRKHIHNIISILQTWKTPCVTNFLPYNYESKGFAGHATPWLTATDEPWKLSSLDAIVTLLSVFVVDIVDGSFSLLSVAVWWIVINIVVVGSRGVCKCSDWFVIGFREGWFAQWLFDMSYVFIGTKIDRLQNEKSIRMVSFNRTFMIIYTSAFFP